MAKLVFDRPIMIFRKDYDGYTIYNYSLTKKDKDGNYVKAYMQCKFRKNVEVSNKALINVQDAWQDFYSTKDGRKIHCIFINDFTYCDSIEESNTKEISLDDILGENNSEDIDIEKLELPFDE